MWKNNKKMSLKNEKIHKLFQKNVSGKFQRKTDFSLNVARFEITLPRGYGEFLLSVMCVFDGSRAHLLCQTNHLERDICDTEAVSLEWTLAIKPLLQFGNLWFSCITSWREMRSFWATFCVKVVHIYHQLVLFFVDSIDQMHTHDFPKICLLYSVRPYFFAVLNV